MTNDVGCQPFFDDVYTTFAVETVVLMFNDGLDADESIKFAADKFKVNPEAVSRYWNIIKKRERWLAV